MAAPFVYLASDMEIKMAGRPDYRITSDITVRDVCKIGKGKECCRYLIGSAHGFECAKYSKELKLVLDARVRDNKMVAQGDNCSGVVRFSSGPI